MIVIRKSSGSGKTVRQEIVFYDKTAHIKSRAAYVILADKLLMQDEDYLSRIDDTLWHWLDVREIYLKRRELENGGNLKCDYCGREHLDIGGKRPEDLIVNNRNKNLATVDHIIAKANDGDKYSEENMCVACKKCNVKKGEMTLEDFLIRMSPKSLLKVVEFLINKASNKSMLEEKILSPPCIFNFTRWYIFLIET